MSAVSSAAMATYYARRAEEYELVYQKPERQSELRALEAWLPTCFEGRHVLEVACGTGWWTPFGAARCASWLATDLNEQTMTVARRKPMPAGRVEFARVDAYTLDGLGERQFDAAFAGCWWSHVPLSRLVYWLETLHARLAHGARVVMLDNSFVQTSSLPICRRGADGNTYQLRHLNDGSVHEVVKNFPSLHSAAQVLGHRAVDLRWTDHPHYWTLEYGLS